MLKYYPLNRIVTNRYTRGNEFSLSDGTPYAGKYYTTYTGESYTGINPVLGASEPLFKINAKKFANKFLVDFTGAASGADNLKLNPNVIYDTVKGTLDTEQESLTELTPYYPVPTDEDYERGYFTRYFAKNYSGPGYIFEISKADWSTIENGQNISNVLGYEIASIFWQLTGPLNDKRISQYQTKGGVYDTNKRVTEAENKTFRGLVEFIGGDYTKFAKITP